MSTVDGESFAGDVEIVCPCGHGIQSHTWTGCHAYVRPTIGGAGACCTRKPTEVVLASDRLADRLAAERRAGAVEALQVARQVESDMSEIARTAWRAADARRGCSDHDALLQYADKVTA